MNVLAPQKRLAVIGALVEGNSIRSVERLTGIHRDTIEIDRNQKALESGGRGFESRQAHFFPLDKIKKQFIL